jgi:hypothetical protein
MGRCRSGERKQQRVLPAMVEVSDVFGDDGDNGCCIRTEQKGLR